MIILSLHSTMSSINPFRKIWKSVWKILYIPLCHLLIRWTNQKPYRIDWLYIPLCHLLIDYDAKRDGLLKEALHSTMSSINPNRSEKESIWICTLHSTMSSINHRRYTMYRIIPHLYIPLCHLLIFSVWYSLTIQNSLYIPLCHLLIWKYKFSHSHG